MSITVRLSTPFREITGGKSELEAEGANLTELFDAIERTAPGFLEMVFEQDGRVHEHAHVFVNGEDYRSLGGLSTSIKDGDVVSVLFAISGG